MNTTRLLYSALSLLTAGFWSVLFAAFRETGNAGIVRLADKKPASKDRLLYWAGRWSLLRTTLRFCLTLFEIAAVGFALSAVNFSHPAEWIALLLGMTLLYMIFIRVIPFVLAESYADRLSVAFLPLVAAVTRLLTPLVWPVYAMERGLLARALSAADEEDRPTAEEEIMTLVDQANDEHLEEEERDIIRSVFEFGETVVREIMTPRVDIEGLKDDATIDECVDKVKHSRHSRFPVYHETIDNVRGVIHVKDLLLLLAQDQESRSVTDITKKMVLVPETMPINDLLKQMQLEHSQMALVVDEYGGTAGVVSMEDIIEELVGEIRDEYDLAEKEIQKHSDGSILIKASLAVADLNEELDLHIPESDEYDSIGGYVICELGTIPKTGDTLTAAGLDITVHNATPHRIHTLLIKPVA
ncbi:MAG: HlyC/CorC family transporter [Verrucomicrobia bacterium]|nr:HlyC/CorC family transporter [Verrucomicrobiota bacterium]